MPVRIMKTLRVVVVVAVATGILVFLLMPGESDGGKTKKGPLVTEKVSVFVKTNAEACYFLFCEILLWMPFATLTLK